MKAGAVIFKSLGAAAVLGGSFFGTLALLSYRAQPAAQHVTHTQPTNGATIALDPAFLRECDAPRAANVSWNVSSAGVQGVKIFVRDKKGQEVFFTGGGAVGTARTASWAVAGTTFIVKDASTLKPIIDGAIGINRC